MTFKFQIDPRTFRDERNRQSTLCLLYSATTGDLTALKRYKCNPLYLLMLVIISSSSIYNEINPSKRVKIYKSDVEL